MSRKSASKDYPSQLSNIKSPRTSLPSIKGGSSTENLRGKSNILAARSSLETVDEYVMKMKNRLDYLANEESRMLKKIDRMNSLIQKREKVLMKKWEDQIQYN